MKSTRISIFLSVSLLWSLLWFSQKHLISSYFGTIQPVAFILLGLIPTFGLLIGGFIMRNKLSHVSITIKGRQPILSLIIFCIPIICLSIIGVDNNFNIQPNLFGALIGTFTLLYATLEEYGWRGYLQQEFMNSSQKWFGYIFIGLVWYIWHWYFLRSSHNPKLIMIPILIISSIGIGEVARITRSILICGALHGLVNILFIYSIVSKSLSDLEKIIIIFICISIWIPLIIRIGNKKQKTTTNTM